MHGFFQECWKKCELSQEDYCEGDKCSRPSCDYYPQKIRVKYRRDFDSVYYISKVALLETFNREVSSSCVSHVLSITSTTNCICRVFSITSITNCIYRVLSITLTTNCICRVFSITSTTNCITVYSPLPQQRTVLPCTLHYLNNELYYRVLSITSTTNGITVYSPLPQQRTVLPCTLHHFNNELYLPCTIHYLNNELNLV